MGKKIKDRPIQPFNNIVTITVGSPLLRPGLTWSTTATEEYVVPVTKRLVGNARGLNADRKPVWQSYVKAE